MASSSNLPSVDPMLAALSQDSTTATFEVSMPAQILQFGNSVKKQSLVTETQRVNERITSLFKDVANYLKQLFDIFAASDSNLQQKTLKLSATAHLLRVESEFFKHKLANTVPDGNEDQAAYTLLTVNSLMLDLLVESCMWDLRLHSTLPLSTTSTQLNPSSGLKEWFWLSFPAISQDMGMANALQSFLPKFECIGSRTPEFLPTAHNLITEEGPRLHTPLVGNDYSGVLSDYEDETSSIIACAIALLALQGKVAESRPETEGVGIPFGPEISPGKEKYMVICYYANRFSELRNLCCPSEDVYLASLSRCRNWEARGGMSDVSFAKTLDDRFIIQEIQEIELDAFLKSAPSYFIHMNGSFQHGNQTCLAKILGIYEVTRRETNGGVEMKRDFIVMENIMYNRQITRQYVLKATLRDHHNPDEDTGEITFYEKFANDMKPSRVNVSQQGKQTLEQAVENDTNFLQSVNVVNYSMLVGEDTVGQELVCGLIDYLRPYSLDKRLGRWMSSSMVFFLYYIASLISAVFRTTNAPPTIIHPREYRKRFRDLISKHFFIVPAKPEDAV